MANTTVISQGIDDRDAYAKSKALSGPSNLSEHDRNKSILTDEVKNRIRDKFKRDSTQPLSGGEAVQIFGNRVAVHYPPPILVPPKQEAKGAVSSPFFVNGDNDAWDKDSPPANTAGVYAFIPVAVLVEDYADVTVTDSNGDTVTIPTSRVTIKGHKFTWDSLGALVSIDTYDTTYFTPFIVLRS